MRKNLFVFLFLAFPSICWGDNVVFNPGFDMSPWDSGWTIEIDTSHNKSTDGKTTMIVEAEVEPDSGRSFPSCCHLRADVSMVDYPPGGGSGWGRAKATITQDFNGITGCMIKAYVKWYLSQKPGIWPPPYVNIQACINNEWKAIWENPGDNWDHPTWTEICTTLADDDTLSGIRFCTSSYFNCSCGFGPWEYGRLWVDDIYVGEIGVEESEELRVKSLELRVCPNPFVQFTDVRLQMSDVRIQVYDMMGRLVEERSEKQEARIGKNLPTGIYFVKVKSYKPVKIIKLGRMQ